MAQVDDTLFGDATEGGESYGRHSTGILPSQILKRLIRARREIIAAEDFEDAQVQPASIDLRLGPVAWRVRGSGRHGRNIPLRPGSRGLAPRPPRFRPLLSRTYRGACLPDREIGLLETGRHGPRLGCHRAGRPPQCQTFGCSLAVYRSLAEVARAARRNTAKKAAPAITAIRLLRKPFTARWRAGIVTLQ